MADEHSCYTWPVSRLSSFQFNGIPEHRFSGNRYSWINRYRLQQTIVESDYEEIDRKEIFYGCQFQKRLSSYCNRNSIQIDIQTKKKL